MTINIKLSNVTIKRIDVTHGFYILAIPDKRNFYTFLLCHDKHAAVLNLFGTSCPQCPDDDILLELAEIGYRDRIGDYLTILEAEDQFN